jgi:hypothetical protein
MCALRPRYNVRYTSRNPKVLLFITRNEIFRRFFFVNLALLLITVYTVEPTLELSSEIYETLIGMTTDVYPRENCIAPAIVLIVWTTYTKNGRGLAPDCVPIVAIRPQRI